MKRTLSKFHRTLNKSQKPLSKYIPGASFQEFLSAMLAFESGIDPALIDEYETNYDNPSATIYWETFIGGPDTARYPAVNQAGNLIPKSMSYQEYFTVLGIEQIWETNPHNADTIYKMQCASVNAWNFVGYQLGEAVLIDAGIYTPEIAEWSDGEKYKKYYIYTDHTWKDDEYEILYDLSANTKIIATRANVWGGHFTGIHGIDYLEDLRDPEKHEMAMRDVIWKNVDYFEKGFSDAGVSLSQALAKEWEDPNNPGTYIHSSMSGLIASSHLSGSQAVVDLVVNDEVVGDETGTSILTYMEKFGDAYTIVDTPENDIITGTKTPERMSCGVGTDQVTTGGTGGNTIYVDLENNTTVEIDTFIPDLDGNYDTLLLRTPDSGLTSPKLTFTSAPPGSSITVEDQGVTLKKIDIIIINSSTLEANADQLILFSKDYSFSWGDNGGLGYQQIDFHDPGDFFTAENAGGLQFSNLLLNKMNASNISIGTLDANDATYSGYIMTGYSAELIHVEMFRGVGGSFSDLRKGFGVSSNDFGTALTEIVVNEFNILEDALYVSGYDIPGVGPSDFSNTQYQQVGLDVKFFPDAGDTYDHEITIRNVSWDDMLTRDPQTIYGFTGSMTDIQQKP